MHSPHLNIYKHESLTKLHPTQLSLQVKKIFVKMFISAPKSAILTWKSRRIFSLLQQAHEEEQGFALMHRLHWSDLKVTTWYLHFHCSFFYPYFLPYILSYYKWRNINDCCLNLTQWICWGGKVSKLQERKPQPAFSNQCVIAKR